MDELKQLQEEYKNLSDLNDKLQTENKYLSDLIEVLRLSKNEMYDIILKLKPETEKLKTEILELKLENIAELKASKILFQMVPKGYTHRLKNNIANYANIILETDIQAKIKDLSKYVDNNNPF